MALTTRHKLIKSLQMAFPRGTPFDHQQLTKLGVSSALAHHYLKSGWLTRLGRGVFMFPNDTLRLEDCLQFLSRRVAGFHVGGGGLNPAVVDGHNNGLTATDVRLGTAPRNGRLLMALAVPVSRGVETAGTPEPSSAVTVRDVV